MKYIKQLIFIALLSSSQMLVAAVDPQTDIEMLNKQLASSFNANQIGNMLDVYADRAVMLPPSSEILNNRTSIQAYWESLKQVGFNNYSIYQVQLDIEGDVAYATAIWEADRSSDNGEIINVSGNISNVFERQADGSWKITLQSWN